MRMFLSQHTDACDPPCRVSSFKRSGRTGRDPEMLQKT
ncbi:hypothetical protein SZ54_4245 [Rhizobium sp. UR51a]|nr:hypothetical protein SZ54_4245 [Rhizobium sp. UR51a]